MALQPTREQQDKIILSLLWKQYTQERYIQVQKMIIEAKNEEITSLESVNRYQLERIKSLREQIRGLS